LVVGTILLGKNLEFSLDVVLGVTYPVSNVAFGFREKFVLHYGKNLVLDVMRETIFGGIDSVQF